MNDIDSLIAKIQKMREDHDWQTSDTPNTLAKSIVIEANELLEAFMTENIDMDIVKSELADVLMYALSLGHDLDLDIEELIEQKIIEVNTRTYDE